MCACMCVSVVVCLCVFLGVCVCVCALIVYLRLMCFLMCTYTRMHLCIYMYVHTLYVSASVCATVSDPNRYLNMVTTKSAKSLVATAMSSSRVKSQWGH